MKREDRKAGFSIYKRSGGYVVYRDGRPCEGSVCRTEEAAKRRMKEIEEWDNTVGKFLYRLAPVQKEAPQGGAGLKWGNHTDEETLE